MTNTTEQLKKLQHDYNLLSTNVATFLDRVEHIKKANVPNWYKFERIMEFINTYLSKEEK